VELAFCERSIGRS